MLVGVNRNRLLLLGAAAAVAVLVVVIVIVVASGGGDGGTTTSAAETTADATTPRTLFAGIPQSGDTLGRADAPATLLVFEDPQCPFCRDWNIDALPTVVNDFVRTGRVRLAFRGINIIGPNSNQGLQAIYSAGRQNKLWQMAEALYRRQGAENSGWITPAVVREAATEAGADPAKVIAGMGATAATLAANAQQASQLGLRGTPSFYLQRPPGLAQQIQVTALDASTFSSELSAALQ
jgi:protein-disulfide isomerase